MKQFLYYFMWTLVIGLILYLGMYLQSQVAEKSQMTFNLFPIQLYIALFPVVIGVLLRTPKFILQLTNSGAWTYHWIKFAAIGLPSLYLVLMTFVPFAPIAEGWLPIPNILLFGGTTVPTVAGLVFGYTVLASVKFCGNSKAEVLETKNPI
ncbi:hypothetical protein B481_3255 [Planococcus halocryophilus Or1]|uniref:Uncharacterized protein n=1 Tax=Planococcus halocryophilus TaxID=1215089 RepID=A0A1C7DNA3_9BACL|nr:hypothetical protein [Planococcus halocryophilus]ANU12907.1 hypothetical protein BBI08_03180 [Planococcus halocryophilus]EMF45394.1 hypothetical protein B481_3255 [Planococcus halocryophilus Or1]